MYMYRFILVAFQLDLLRLFGCDNSSGMASYPSQLTPQPAQVFSGPIHQVAPADFAQNMDLVTERAASKPGTLSTLFGPVASAVSQSLGAATAADQVAIEKAAKWYRGAAGLHLFNINRQHLTASNMTMFVKHFTRLPARGAVNFRRRSTRIRRIRARSSSVASPGTSRTV